MASIVCQDVYSAAIVLGGGYDRRNINRIRYVEDFRICRFVSYSNSILPSRDYVPGHDVPCGLIAFPKSQEPQGMPVIKTFDLWLLEVLLEF
jgi:hypothetical protein